MTKRVETGEDKQFMSLVMDCVKSMRVKQEKKDQMIKLLSTDFKNQIMMHRTTQSPFRQSSDED